MNFLIAIPFGKYLKNRTKYFGGPVMSITATSKKAALAQYTKNLCAIGKDGLTMFPPDVVGRFMFSGWHRTNFNVTSVEFSDILRGELTNVD